MILPDEKNPVRALCGDCVDVLDPASDGCFDSVVTDPPYGLEFMGKEWDSFSGWQVGSGFSKPGIGEREIAWPSFTGCSDEFGGANPTCAACGGRARGKKKCGCAEPDWRVKGAPPDPMYGRLRQMRAFGDWCGKWAAAIFRVLKPGGYMLCFGGTRTYHRLTCAVEDAGFEVRDCIMWVYGTGFPKNDACLKPAWEPILLCRKPGKRVLPLRIDACRSEPSGESRQRAGEASADRRYYDSGGTDFSATPGVRGGDPAGRYPANLVHDGSDEVTEAFAAFGERSGPRKPARRGAAGDGWGMGEGEREAFQDAGTAARFFYCAKASKAERAGSKHPTVKPLALMRWLVRLVTPPGGLVLDPFFGSGTTGLACRAEGVRCLGIEKEIEYCRQARRRNGLVS